MMSKGLESFEKVNEYVECCLGYRNYCEAMGYTSTGLFLFPHIENIRKELKALEIVKEKEIDVALFKECPNYDEYIKWCSEKAKLTLQEYDLLREVML